MTVWGYIFATWPPAAAGLFLTWYLAVRKVKQVTSQQTNDIQDITDKQTKTLLGHQDHRTPRV